MPACMFLPGLAQERGKNNTHDSRGWAPFSHSKGRLNGGYRYGCESILDTCWFQSSAIKLSCTSQHLVRASSHEVTYKIRGVWSIFLDSDWICEWTPKHLAWFPGSSLSLDGSEKECSPFRHDVTLFHVTRWMWNALNGQTGMFWK